MHTVKYRICIDNGEDFDEFRARCTSCDANDSPTVDNPEPRLCAVFDIDHFCELSVAFLSYISNEIHNNREQNSAIKHKHSQYW